MTQFLLPALGGAFLALSAILLMASLGRIAGISGIVGGLLPPKPAAGDEATWRYAFIVGLLLGPVVLQLVTGASGIGAPAASLPAMLASGLLVGIGTALGSGCTSGHGICGLPRLSVRSFVAVGTFMATGAATVFVTHHLL